MAQIARPLLLLSVCLAAVAADKYEGPRPPKPDIPYILHASNLIETEVAQATEDKKGKDEMIYRVNGAASPVRTPLAEPIFIFDSEKISPEGLELYKFDVRGGNREVVERKKRGARAYRLLTTPLGGKLYRIEVNEGMGLENGEYGLTPRDSNQVFCFAVY